MKIDVTQQDIDNGHRNKCYACPIALAITRVTGVVFAVHKLEIKREENRWDIPRDVTRFIQDFDGERPVSPFSFEIPDEFMERAMQYDG